MKKNIRRALPFLIVTLITGCESDPDRDTSAKFGETVRNTIALQTASTKTTGPGLDAVKSREILKAYRTDVGQRQKIEQPMILNINSGGSGGGK